jgi:hypothetical protein
MADMKKELTILKKLLTSMNNNKISSDEIESRLNMFCQRFMLSLNKYDERVQKIFDNYDIPQLTDIHTIFGLAFETLDVNNNNWAEDFSEVYDETIYPIYNAKKRKKNILSAFNSLSISNEAKEGSLTVEFDEDEEDKEINNSSSCVQSQNLKCEYIYKKGANANKQCSVRASCTTDKGPRCKSHAKS